MTIQEPLPAMLALAKANWKPPTPLGRVIASLPQEWEVVERALADFLCSDFTDSEYGRLNDHIAASKHASNYYRDYC